MDNFFQITSLKYNLENQAIKERALKYGIISLAYEMMHLCENLLLNGVTGFFPGLGYFRLEMLDKKDWALLARVWKWLYQEQNPRIAHIIARFS